LVFVIEPKQIAVIAAIAAAVFVACRFAEQRMTKGGA